MEMQAGKVYVTAPSQQVDHGIELMTGNTEFVFEQTRSHVLMGMGIDIRIYPRRYPRPQPEGCGHGIDHIYLMQGFAVERFDSGIQGFMDLPVALAYSGKYYPAGRKTALQSPPHLVPAHAVRTDAASRYGLEDASFHIGLYGIMDIDSIFPGKGCKGIYGMAKQLHIVIIERSGDLLEFLYGCRVNHKI